METHQTARSPIKKMVWFVVGSIVLFGLLYISLFIVTANDWFDSGFASVAGIHKLISQLMSASRDVGVVAALYVVAQGWLTNRYARHLKGMSRKVRYACVAAVVIVASVVAAHVSDTQMRAIQRESVQPESVLHS